MLKKTRNDTYTKLNGESVAVDGAVEDEGQAAAQVVELQLDVADVAGDELALAAALGGAAEGKVDVGRHGGGDGAPHAQHAPRQTPRLLGRPRPRPLARCHCPPLGPRRHCHFCDICDICDICDSGD